MSELEQRAEQIKLISWSDKRTQKRSQVRLLQEHLRRSALWSLELRAAGWPFYDIAHYIDPEARAPEACVREVHESMSGNGSYHVVKTVEWSLHFSFLKDNGFDLTRFPDPFTPLIRLYERGGMVNLDSTGFIEVNGIGTPRKTAEKYATIRPLLEFDEEALQEMDRKN
ncbi:hypothetical protein ACIRPH_13290 [Nocardiopsis sp. NPDC101807]|uniref:hypothetical protein n=1 Tax=Nocardiopsis sp. NPDC101807 TaxID=3364339 RepID=UPI003800D47B